MCWIKNGAWRYKNNSGASDENALFSVFSFMRDSSSVFSLSLFFAENRIAENGNLRFFSSYYVGISFIELPD